MSIRAIPIEERNRFKARWAALWGEPRIILGRRVPRLDALPPEEAAQWRRQLEGLAADCGCAVGAVVTVAATALYSILVALNPGIGFGSTWANIGVGILVFILSAGVGKSSGILRARRKLDKLVLKLTERLLAL